MAESARGNSFLQRTREKIDGRRGFLIKFCLCHYTCVINFLFEQEFHVEFGQNGDQIASMEFYYHALLTFLLSPPRLTMQLGSFGRCRSAGEFCSAKCGSDHIGSCCAETKDRENAKRPPSCFHSSAQSSPWS